MTTLHEWWSTTSTCHQFRRSLRTRSTLLSTIFTLYYLYVDKYLKNKRRRTCIFIQFWVKDARLFWNVASVNACFSTSCFVGFVPWAYVTRFFSFLSPFSCLPPSYFPFLSVYVLINIFQFIFYLFLSPLSFLFCLCRLIVSVCLSLYFFCLSVCLSMSLSTILQFSTILCLHLLFLMCRM